MKTPIPALFLTFFSIAPGGTPALHAEPPAATFLRCESLVDPLGLDEPLPRLSWQLASRERGARQTAYRILVASTAELLAKDSGDLWDSGTVESAESIEIPYAGKPLASRQTCFWKVKTRDGRGEESPWSPPASWTMGLLDPGDWSAAWIGKDGAEAAFLPEKTGPYSPPGTGREHRPLPARMLRREFAVGKPVARATAYFSGLGLSEFSLNGVKIGDAVLSPGLTEYSERVLYVTRDVTPHLRPGANAVGIWLGNGRFYAPRLLTPFKTRSYGFPKLLFQLEIEYADGTRETVANDPSWKVTDRGPIRENNEYDGEIYDARMEMPGWDAAGFDDAAWEPAAPVAPPGGRLCAEANPPIRVTGTLRPVSVAEPAPGVFVFDMGQNMVGWCRLRVEGPPGTAVSLRHAENIHPDGSIDLANIRDARVTDTYTLKGGGPETYEPRFTYHGFRYVEVTGFPGKPSPDAIEGRVVNDDLPTAGEFSCSDPRINRIYRNVLWGTRGNYRSIPTDCPQRDERQGWLGDRSAEAKGETYLFDISALYSKWMRDIADAQLENGSIPNVCPPYWPIYEDNVTWPSSAVIIPGALHEQYGDTRILERCYPTMVRWMDRIGASAKDGLLELDKYGDWCVPPEDPRTIHSKDPKQKTAKAILATSYFAHCAGLVARYAKILGKPDDATRFAALAERSKSALNERCFRPDIGYYDNGSQTSCVLPLAFGLVPDAERGRVFAHLENKILRESKGRVGTGLVGGQWLCRTLAENGRNDLAYQLATNTTYPSWGFMAEQGATTVWELWNGNTADPTMNSGNHVMLVGDLVIWLHETVAGIRPDPDRPGFRHILMRPQPGGGLTSAKASHRSPYGMAESDWKIENGSFLWRVTVPPNSTATAHIPTTAPDRVTESGKPLDSAEGVRPLGAGHGTATVALESGSYVFAAPFAAPSAPAEPEP